MNLDLPNLRPSGQRILQRWLGVRGVVLPFSRLGIFGHVGDLCQLADSTLPSHDAVSDDLSWPTPHFIVRVNLLASFWHKHRSQRAFSQDTMEAHPSRFFRKSLQVCPETSHSTLLCTRFQASSEPQRCRLMVSESQHVSVPDWHSIDMSQTTWTR